MRVWAAQIILTHSTEDNRTIAAVPMHMHVEKTPAMMELTICPTCRSPSCMCPWCTNRAPPPALCVSSTNTTAEPELDAPLLLLLLLLLFSLLYRWPWSPICTDS